MGLVTFYPGDRLMRALLAIAIAMFVPVCASAQGAKPCEDLKSEIAKKLDDRGVKSYSLDIVAKDQDTDGKVVGTCEGGAKKIVYRRGGAVAEPAAKESSKP
jgi:outer membrane lipoprotein-sorting protein